MCGYVGFINDTVKYKEPIIKKMMDRIIHRGPDSEGVYIDRSIAIGFRRLSIIGLEDGMQPIYNENRKLILVFNGEIYNYQELKEELLKKGHVFYTHADSEVVVHMYEEYGKEMISQLRGMFSFSIWDTEKKTLFMVRDYFGIKPLYYGKIKDTFFFGSEIKSFLDHPDFEKKLNLDALESYLSFQYSSLPETFFKGIYKLTPGHYGYYKNGNLEVKRYFQPSFDENKGTQSLESFIDTIEEAFKGSVEAHKTSDVEVGSFLSSGIDSSYIAATFKGDKTFTVGFNYDNYSEIEYAKELSAQMGIQNKNKWISDEEYWNVLPKVQYHMDEPLADPSAIALYFVSQIASEDVKVALSGEGADELFGGYTIYKEPINLSAYQKFPKALRAGFSKLARRLPKIKGRSFLIRGNMEVEDRFIGNANIFSNEDRKNLLKVKTNAPSTKEVTKPFYDFAKNYNDTTKMQFTDINTWLIGDILLKADKMSMAHSLEIRVPFLDKEIYKVARTVPLKYKVNSKNTKYALRLAARRSLPKVVADKKKLGFPVPTRVWLTQDTYYNKVKEAFNSPIAKTLFKEEKISQLLDDHYNGKEDYSRKIWTIYIFLVWYDVCKRKVSRKL